MPGKNPSPAKRILLIHPPARSIYSRTVIREGAPVSPPLWPAAITPSLISCGHIVRFIDLNLSRHPDRRLLETLESFHPNAVGIYFTTPHFPEVQDILALIGQRNPRPRAILGGPHPSALPLDTLSKLPGDVVSIGEGDFTLAEVLSNTDLSQVNGIAYRGKNGECIQNPPRDPIRNLDMLPFPAWELFNLTRYRTTRLLSRRNPVGWIETSRGCPYSCPFCSKSVFGSRFRAKSPERVIEEIRKMLELGFREIHIADDGFTTDPDRAMEICERIITEELAVPWSPVTGVRIDTLNHTLLARMKAAGCYRICLGIESGSQRILDGIGKGISLEQIEEVVAWCRELGLETFGYFMIGLPHEDEVSMKATIRFARSLKLDLAKISYAIPLPATPLHRELSEKGLLHNNRWPDYNLYRSPKHLYIHPDCDWKIIELYFRKFYRSFYLNPRYFFHRIFSSLKQNTIASDFVSMLKTPW